jgi:hypothetical protein
MRSNGKKKQGNKATRGFAVLDRDKSLKSATGAVQALRGLSVYAASVAAWQCGLGYALELVECQLNDILLFSSSNRLPDELFLGGVAVPVVAEVGQVRRDAAAAVKVFRRLWKDARADLSVDESQCNRLEQALDQVEVKLNELLPPPGKAPRAKLPSGYFDDEEDGAVTADCNLEDQGGVS